MDYSLPGSSSTGKLQARILEWVATPDLPYPGIEPTSPALQVDSLPSEPPGKPQLCWTTGKYSHFPSQNGVILFMGRADSKEKGTQK